MHLMHLSGLIISFYKKSKEYLIAEPEKINNTIIDINTIQITDKRSIK